MIWPVAALMKNVVVSETEKTTESPSTSLAVSAAPTGVPGGEFSAISRTIGTPFVPSSWTGVFGVRVLPRPVSDQEPSPSLLSARTCTSYSVPESSPFSVVALPAPLKRCDVHPVAPTVR